MSTEEHTGAVEELDKLHEFERKPVSEDKLQPGRCFAGLITGEHAAGTEFTIRRAFRGLRIQRIPGKAQQDSAERESIYE